MPNQGQQALLLPSGAPAPLAGRLPLVPRLPVAANSEEAGSEEASGSQGNGSGLTPRGREMLESLKRGRDPGCLPCFGCGAASFLEVVESGGSVG